MSGRNRDRACHEPGGPAVFPAGRRSGYGEESSTWRTVRELQQFSACIGIDLLGFAVLSNHIHLIVRSRPNVVVTSDDTEVARRWLNIRWRVRMFDRTDLAGRAEYLVGDRRPLAELVF